MKAIYIIVVTVIWVVSMILIIKYVPDKKKEPLIFPFPLTHSFPKEENNVYHSDRTMSAQEGWKIGGTSLILSNKGRIENVKIYDKILTDDEIKIILGQTTWGPIR